LYKGATRFLFFEIGAKFETIEFSANFKFNVSFHRVRIFLTFFFTSFIVT